MKKFIILPLLGLFLLAGCSYPASKEENKMLEDDNQSMTSEEVSLDNGVHQIDTSNSVISWSADKVVRPGHTGTINIGSGSFEISDNKLVNGVVIIDMASIKSDEGIAKLEEHLASDDFFSVNTYPESKITLNSMTLDSQSGDYMVEGDLTIKDITRPVSFKAQIQEEGEGFRITSDFSINRVDWNIVWGDGSGLDSLKDKVLKDKINFKLNILAS